MGPTGSDTTEHTRAAGESRCPPRPPPPGSFAAVSAPWPWCGLALPAAGAAWWDGDAGEGRPAESAACSKEPSSSPRRAPAPGSTRGQQARRETGSGGPLGAPHSGFRTETGLRSGGEYGLVRASSPAPSSSAAQAGTDTLCFRRGGRGFHPRSGN